jgi:predicted RNase H-like HicB family nuclease
MKFNVTINRDEDGFWIVECPSIPGCVSQGQSRSDQEKTLENIKDAIDACLQVHVEQGFLLTQTQQVDVSASKLVCAC